MVNIHLYLYLLYLNSDSEWSLIPFNFEKL